MSDLEMIAGLVLISVSTSLGWGLRGVWGHWWGATVPGAFCGMAIWLSFGPTPDAWQMLLFGAAIALSLTIGGTISTLKVVGYVRGEIPGNKGYHDWTYDRSPLFGLAGVFLVGGMWGLFPGIALGLLMTGVEYTMADLTLWALLASISSYLAYKLLVLGLDLHLSPPRSDTWAAVLGGSVATLAYFYFIPGDDVVLVCGVLGWLGFGFGYQAGALIHRYCTRRALQLPSWKMAEHTIGFFGGLGLGVAALVEGDLEAIPVGEAGMLASAFTVLWLTPYMNVTNTVEFWLRGKMLDFRTYVPAEKQDKGPTWITRRTFAVSQFLALLSLVPFTYFALELVENWAGTEGYTWPFVLLIVLLTLAAMGKQKFERSRKMITVYSIFVAQALICVILAFFI